MFDELKAIVIGLILFIGAILLVGIVCTSITESVCKPMLTKIDKMGYDSREVRVFVRRIGADLEDFIASKGIRKQYELFINGESSDFIKQAERIKQESDKQSQGFATGIAVGTAIRSR